MRLAKAQGLGNDFLLVARDQAPEDVVGWTRRLCDRHLGIGADGLILYTVGEGRATMRLLNADGGEAEISGNGLRCLSGYVVLKGWLPPSHRVETGAGSRQVEASSVAAGRFRVVTELGAPILDSRRIPLALDAPRERVIDLDVPLGDRSVSVTCTSMGNPHCALFLEEPADDALVRSIGPALEHHPLFPRRTNVEFVTVMTPRQLRVRFWERGVGHTRSSGTGAASAVVAAAIAGRAERSARVVCDGGVLEVDWSEGGSVRQIGEVEVLFEGEWLAG